MNNALAEPTAVKVGTTILTLDTRHPAIRPW